MRDKIITSVLFIFFIASNIIYPIIQIVRQHTSGPTTAIFTSEEISEKTLIIDPKITLKHKILHIGWQMFPMMEYEQYLVFIEDETHGCLFYRLDIFHLKKEPPEKSGQLEKKCSQSFVFTWSNVTFSTIEINIIVDKFEEFTCSKLKVIIKAYVSGKVKHTYSDYVYIFPQEKPPDPIFLPVSTFKDFKLKWKPIECVEDYQIKVIRPKGSNLDPLNFVGESFDLNCKPSAKDCEYHFKNKFSVVNARLSYRGIGKTNNNYSTFYGEWSSLISCIDHDRPVDVKIEKISYFSSVKYFVHWTGFNGVCSAKYFEGGANTPVKNKYNVLGKLYDSPNNLKITCKIRGNSNAGNVFQCKSVTAKYSCIFELKITKLSVRYKTKYSFSLTWKIDKHCNQFKGKFELLENSSMKNIFVKDTKYNFIVEKNRPLPYFYAFRVRAVDITNVSGHWSQWAMISGRYMTKPNSFNFIYIALGVYLFAAVIVSVMIKVIYF